MAGARFAVDRVRRAELKTPGNSARSNNPDGRLRVDGPSKLRQQDRSPHRRKRRRPQRRNRLVRHPAQPPIGEPSRARRRGRSLYRRTTGLAPSSHRRSGLPPRSPRFVGRLERPSTGEPFHARRHVFNVLSFRLVAQHAISESARRPVCVPADSRQGQRIEAAESIEGTRTPSRRCLAEVVGT